MTRLHPASTTSAFTLSVLVALVAVAVGYGQASGQIVAAADVAAQNRRCFNCHGQPLIAELGPAQRGAMVQPAPTEPTPPAERPELYVPPDALAHAGGVHARLRCTDCHADAAQLPHPRKLQPASCNDSCHAQSAAEHRRSVHALAQARGDPLAPTCVSCHSAGDAHDIRSARDPRSPTFPLHVVKVCGDCHEKHRAPSANGHDQKEFVHSFLDSVHGKAVEGGLVVAATCVSCHNNHDIQPAGNAESSIHRDRVPGTCGKCHHGVEQSYARSIHGQKLAAGGAKAPVCTDCHTAHAITRAGTDAFMLDIVGECGKCHDQPIKGGVTSLYQTYRRSYHGQVTQLGSTRAARCSDCHGAHDILPADDPSSRVHQSNLIQTCGQCHRGVNEKFIQFQAHADFRDRKNFPLLHGVWLYFIILMSVTFAFWGLHSALWLGRSVLERVRHGPHPKFTANPHGVKRFARINRINHALLIVSFFGLTLTGMPLLFSDQGWARGLALLFGGPRAAGVLHRVFAVMLMVNFVIHVLFLIRKARTISLKRMFFGPATLLPRWRDWKDFVGMTRWFFKGGTKPTFEHWTYWEKFDYWAEIVGTFIIGGSGLILWFPVFFSQWLPGWVFNIATVVHGYEAMLAVGFIFTIHFFNAHLRLEKFPVDDVMFTGQLPEEELKHERPDEYARLVKTGELAGLLEPPAPRWQRHVAVATGVVAMVIGTILVVLIVIGGLAAI